LLGVRESARALSQADLAAKQREIPRLDGLKIEEKDIEVTTSLAYKENATKLWWHNVPYICVLQMKKSGALFMAQIPESEEFVLVGFEDPGEAFNAGKMPLKQQFWGVVENMQSRSGQPLQPLDTEKYFDLTWLQPKEFNRLLATTNLRGIVVPAGTFRDPYTQRNVDAGEIKAKIEEVIQEEVST